MSTLRTSCLAFAGLLVAVAPAQDPVAELVPEGTLVVGYFDLQRLQNLFGGHDRLARAVREHAGGDEDVLAHIEQEWGFDPLRDVQAVVLYGGHDRSKGTLALVTTDRIDRALGRLRQAGALTPFGRGDLERIDPAGVVRLMADGGDVDVDGDTDLYVHVRNLPPYRGEGRRALVFGTDARALAGAVQGRHRGRGADLRLPEGCIAAVEVQVSLDDLGDEAISRLASKAKRLSIRFVDSGDEVVLDARVETETARDARRIAALVNGLKALIDLVGQSEDVPEEIAEALADAHAEAAGNDVTLRVALPKQLVERALEEAGVGGGAEDERRPPGRRRRVIR